METEGFLEHDGARLVWRRVECDGPTVVWLGGFFSDLTGIKAQALADWAQAHGRAYLRFDYYAHGASDGDPVLGTITRWRSDALAMIDLLTQGLLVLVGSSMGGWLACLVALARPERVKAMVLIAPAADFTERLIKPALDAQAWRAIEQDGVWMRPSDYGDGQPISRELLEDGARWSILPGPVDIEVPIRILQGGEDPDVPWRHGLELCLALKASDLVFSLVRDGDHRLSRPQDIERLVAMVEELIRL